MRTKQTEKMKRTSISSGETKEETTGDAVKAETSAATVDHHSADLPTLLRLAAANLPLNLRIRKAPVVGIVSLETKVANVSLIVRGSNPFKRV